MTVRIREKTNPDAFASWLQYAAKKSKTDAVAVGIIGEGAVTPHPKSKDGTTVGEIANANEYGLGVTERPFIRGYVDAHEKEILADIRYTAKVAANTNSTFAWMLDNIGKFVREGISKFILNHGEGTYPPNTPQTIKAKGSTVPLVDTHLTLDLIDYEIRRRTK